MDRGLSRVGAGVGFRTPGAAETAAACGNSSDAGSHVQFLSDLCQMGCLNLGPLSSPGGKAIEVAKLSHF